MFEPTNEQGVIVLFAQQAKQAGIEIVEIQTQYPDAIIKKDGQTYRAEFEFESSNFVVHKHEPADCDIIICWRHDWDDCPLPVIELKNPNWKQKKLTLDDLTAALNSAGYWKKRALRAEKIIKLKGIRDDGTYPKGFSKGTAERGLDILIAAIENGEKISGAEFARRVGISNRKGLDLKKELWDRAALAANGHNTNGHGGES